MRKNSTYIFCVMSALCVLGIAIVFTPEPALHIGFNKYHTTTQDFFFKYFTLLAEGLPYVLFLALLFYQLGSACFLLSAEVLTGIVVQIIKNAVQAPRPSTVLDLLNNDIVPLVEGVSLNSSYSFPSGHSATFVSMFFCLSLIIASQQLSTLTRHLTQAFLATLALLGCFSRIYLSQHFAKDVLVGALIGLIVPMLIYPFFLKWQSHNSQTYKWTITKNKPTKNKSH